jgi:hypothetical protein
VWKNNIFRFSLRSLSSLSIDKHTDTSSVTPGHDGSIKDTKPPELPAGGAGETYKADDFELSGDIDDGECKFLPTKENDEVETTKGFKSPGRRKRVKPWFP